MKLCTFEVATPLGPTRRLGAVREFGIVDLNLACQRMLEREGEARPRHLAAVVLPDNMLEYLQEGSTARCYAGKVLSGLRAGEEDPDGAKLVHAPEQVRLLAPLPNPPSLRDFYAFEDHVKKGFERRGEPMPQPRCRS